MTGKTDMVPVLNLPSHLSQPSQSENVPIFGSAANVTKVTAEADGTSDMSTDRMEELYSNILDEMEAGDYLSREDIIGAKEVSVKLRIEVEGVVRDGTALVCVAECQKSWEAVGLQFSWD